MVVHDCENCLYENYLTSDDPCATCSEILHGSYSQFTIKPSLQPTVTFRCPFCGQKQTWGPFRDEGVHAYTSDGEEIDAGQRTNVNADGTQHHCPEANE